MKKSIISTVVLACLSVGHAQASSSTYQTQSYTSTYDVPYAEGLVTVEGEVEKRDLLMDVIQPTTPLADKNPVVVMTFGGNFIRGGRDFTYDMAGAQTTTMRQYCELFAQRGYTCVAPEYRLSLEGPVISNIGYSDDDLDLDHLDNRVLHERNNWIREGMGLEPLDYADRPMRAAVLSGTEDIYKLVQHLVDNAEQYNIDPERIALGGFSAGGNISFNVAYGMNAPVKAVMVNSAASIGFNLEKTMAGRTENIPPAMIHMGQFDIEAVRVGTMLQLPTYEKLGIEADVAWVPNYGHFYPSGATVLANNLERETVLTRMLNFLDKNL